MRQAEQDIGVQRPDAACAEPVGGKLRDLEALVAADGLLDHRVEVLHPDRGAVHPRPRQRVEPRFVDLVRVDLDRELAIRRHRRDGEDCRGQVRDRGRGQERGRAAAPMQPRQGDAPRQGGAQQIQLRFQCFDIGDDRIVGGRALRPAGAEPAQAAAERYMNIKGNLAFWCNGAKP